MYVELEGTVRDAVAALSPQRVSWPRGAAGTVVVRVRRASDGAVVDVTGLKAKLTIRALNTIGEADGVPLVARESTVLVGVDGTLKIELAEADTIELQEKKTHRFDIHFTDSQAKRWQIVPQSEWYVEPIVGFSTDPASAP